MISSERFIMMGPPGAGKGHRPILSKIVIRFRIFLREICFREAVSTGTELGKEAKKYMDSGKLVPDEVTIGIVQERLAQDDCKEGFLLMVFRELSSKLKL